MTKTLTLTFHSTTIKPLTEGLKYVLFRITAADAGQLLGHEWGFADYSFDKGWETITDHGAVASVEWWTELTDPKGFVASVEKSVPLW